MKNLIYHFFPFPLFPLEFINLFLYLLFESILENHRLNTRSIVGIVHTILKSIIIDFVPLEFELITFYHLPSKYYT